MLAMDNSSAWESVWQPRGHHIISSYLYTKPCKAVYPTPSLLLSGVCARTAPANTAIPKKSMMRFTVSSMGAADRSRAGPVQMIGQVAWRELLF